MKKQIKAIVRKVGGSLYLAVDPSVRKENNLEAGDELQIEVVAVAPQGDLTKVRFIENPEILVGADGSSVVENRNAFKRTEMPSDRTKGLKVSQHTLANTFCIREQINGVSINLVYDPSLGVELYEEEEVSKLQNLVIH